MKPAVCRLVSLRPRAWSIPWIGIGVYTSWILYPCERTFFIAGKSTSSSVKMPTTNFLTAIAITFNTLVGMCIFVCEFFDGFPLDPVYLGCFLVGLTRFLQDML